jgi:stage III sporulation protein SpoIIIAA
MEPTQVMEFSKGKLESLIVGRPDIGLKLYREIARELAQRLATVNGDLKDAIVWALGESKHPTVPLVASLRRLSVLPPSGAGAQSKIVVT